MEKKKEVPFQRVLPQMPVASNLQIKSHKMKQINERDGVVGKKKSSSMRLEKSFKKLTIVKEWKDAVLAFELSIWIWGKYYHLYTFLILTYTSLLSYCPFLTVPLHSLSLFSSLFLLSSRCVSHFLSTSHTSLTAHIVSLQYYLSLFLSNLWTFSLSLCQSPCPLFFHSLVFLYPMHCILWLLIVVVPCDVFVFRVL